MQDLCINAIYSKQYKGNDYRLFMISEKGTVFIYQNLNQLPID